MTGNLPRALSSSLLAHPGWPPGTQLSLWPQGGPSGSPLFSILVPGLCLLAVTTPGTCWHCCIYGIVTAILHPYSLRHSKSLSKQIQRAPQTPAFRILVLISSGTFLTLGLLMNTSRTGSQTSPRLIDGCDCAPAILALILQATRWRAALCFP